MSSEIERRKGDHLDLCSTNQVEFREKTTLLECVTLMHQSLPELSVDEIDLGVELLGKRLRAPLVIASMTGGTEKAARVNHELSKIAEARGYGFGLGSQRAMQKMPESAWTFQVREHAPTTLILGNVGVVQAREAGTRALATLVEDIGADALCLHMNPAMELIQSEGDRDFRGCAEAMGRLARELQVPVIAKETGAGISLQTAQKLRDLGVAAVDVSGAGGTSWVGVETLRAEGPSRILGELLWNWGVPTGASVAYVAGCGLPAIATGGIRNGLDVARSIALGASAAGLARPVLQAFMEGGREGAEALLERVERELASVMLLCGARTIADLQRAPRVLHAPLKDWLEPLDAWRTAGG